MKHKIFPAEQSLINTAADGETPGELHFRNTRADTASVC